MIENIQAFEYNNICCQKSLNKAGVSLPVIADSDNPDITFVQKINCDKIPDNIISESLPPFYQRRSTILREYENVNLQDD